MPATSSKPVKPAAQPPQQPWLLRHGQQVLIAAAVALGAALLSVVVSSRLSRAEDQAWEQLSTALSLSSQNRREDAVKTLDSLLSARRSGPAAVQAYLMKSDLLLSLGKKPEALDAAREAGRQAVTPEYKALASVSLAHAAEESGRPEQAVEEYARFIKDFPDHFLVARATSQMARIDVALGKPAEAKAAYEKVVTLYPSTVWARDAKAALDEMKLAAAPGK